MTDTPSLYAPPPFRAAEPASLVRRYPFAWLITSAAGEMHATATPLFFESDGAASALVGHLARQNPQAQALRPGQPALAVFSGPHAYISAAWYRARPTVPTWNYLAAQVRGTLEPIDDAAATLKILERTAQRLEHGPAPWTLEQAPAGKVAALLPGVRAFRITVTRIEGVTKLSQTHPPADRLRVIRRLLERGDAASLEIARLMTHLEEPID